MGHMHRENDMKALISIALAIGSLGSVGTAVAQTSVGVSIGINQPGVYGRIDIGNLPQPALILAQPVWIEQPRYEQRPIYLYVPPSHQQNWSRYCGQYSACGQPVYFVRDDYVRQRYEREHPGWDNGRHRGWDKHDEGGRDDDRDDHGHKEKYKDKGKGH